MRKTTAVVCISVSLVAAAVAFLYFTRVRQPLLVDDASVAEFKQLNGLGMCPMFTPRNWAEGPLSSVRRFVGFA